jgi:FkbM family methyltransferase
MGIQIDYYAEALKFAEQGQLPEAITNLYQVLSRDPLNSIARSDLGALLFESGEIIRAKAELALAHTQKPSDPVITENYLEILLATNSIDEVYSRIEILVKAVSSNSNLIQRVSEAVNRQMEFVELANWDRTIEGVTQKVTSQVLPFLPPNGVLIDVGANCGLFTEQILRERDVKAYLFEPVPKYFNYCKSKFENKENVVIENVALTERSGNLQIFVDRQNLGWNTLLQTKCTPGMTPVDIKAETFDTYAERNNIDKIDVIKIDVEGSEFRVLKGMQKTLSKLKQKPVIICEVAWGANGHPNWQEEIEAFEWLFSNGYQRTDYNVSGTSDVVFMPS